MRLNKTAISKLKPKANRQYVYDSTDPRMGIVIHPTGKKMWHARLTIDGKTRRVNIAPVGDLRGKYGMDHELKLVRERVAEIVASVARGEDPRPAATGKTGCPTLRETMETYLESRRTQKGTMPLKDSTKKDVEQRLKVTFKDYMDQPLDALDESIVQRIHSERSAVAPTATSGAFRYLQSIWNYAAASSETKNYLQGRDNPVLVLSALKIKFTPPRKKTRIDNDDLPTWWATVHELKAVDRDLLVFCLLTGCRVGTSGQGGATSLTWANLEAEWYTIEDTKDRKTHTLPLPGYVSELLEQRRGHDSDPVFPNHQGGRRAYEAVEQACGVKATMHDLRRTFASIAAGETPFLKQLMMHSTDASVTDGYVIADDEQLQKASREVAARILEVANVS